MTDLTGKTAFITGASRGIGEAAAREMAKAGAAVVLAARSTDAIERIATEIDETGGKAIAVPCDVADYAAVTAALDAATAAFGSLDILVNNAGTIEPIARLADSDPAGWGEAVDVNVKGVYHGIRAALERMESGVIVNISSGAATGVLEGWSHYCASKAAVLSLTRCAELETPDAIRVVGLSPGTVATQMQREIKASGINRVSTLDWGDHIPPEWVGRALVWLCGPDGSEFRGEDVALRDEAIRARIGLG